MDGQMDEAVGGFFPTPQGLRPAWLPGAWVIKAACTPPLCFEDREGCMWGWPKPRHARGLVFSGFYNTAISADVH